MTNSNLYHELVTDRNFYPRHRSLESQQDDTEKMDPDAIDALLDLLHLRLRILKMRRTLLARNMRNPVRQRRRC